MCALINGRVGWLLYLNKEGDVGLNSVNPDFLGSKKSFIEYRLDNGQVNEYPECWMYDVNIVKRALDYFEETGELPEFIDWDD